MNEMLSTLSEDIAMLLNSLSEHYAIPEYEVIAIVVESGELYANDGKPQIKKSAMLSVADFSNEYERLKSSGFSWINLQAAGIYKNMLVCIVEHPKKSIGSAVTSVNFSGPFRNSQSGEYDWDLNQHYDIFE